MLRRFTSVSSIRHRTSMRRFMSTALNSDKKPPTNKDAQLFKCVVLGTTIAGTSLGFYKSTKFPHTANGLGYLWAIGGGAVVGGTLPMSLLMSPIAFGGWVVIARIWYGVIDLD